MQRERAASLRQELVEGALLFLPRGLRRLVLLVDRNGIYNIIPVKPYLGVGAPRKASLVATVNAVLLLLLLIVVVAFAFAVACAFAFAFAFAFVFAVVFVLFLCLLLFGFAFALPSHTHTHTRMFLHSLTGCA